MTSCDFESLFDPPSSLIPTLYKNVTVVTKSLTPFHVIYERPIKKLIFCNQAKPDKLGTYPLDRILVRGEQWP